MSHKLELSQWGALSLVNLDLLQSLGTFLTVQHLVNHRLSPPPAFPELNKRREGKLCSCLFSPAN